MRKSFLLACLLLATTTITAQDIIIKGHVVNERNSAVEYATVGIPGTRYGTLTGIDGWFEFTLPQNCNDTLVVTHVSYGEARIPPEAYMNTDSALVVTMQSHKLGEVVVYNGKRKNAKLQNKGVRIAGAVTSWNIDNIGNEVGWFESHGDSFVDFGIYGDNERVRAFVNGFEPSILLNFNCVPKFPGDLPKY